jgi:hypothetical protein
VTQGEHEAVPDKVVRLVRVVGVVGTIGWCCVRLIFRGSFTALRGPLATYITCLYACAVLVLHRKDEVAAAQGATMAAAASERAAQPAAAIYSPPDGVASFGGYAIDCKLASGRCWAGGLIKLCRHGQKLVVQPAPPAPEGLARVQGSAWCPHLGHQAQHTSPIGDSRRQACVPMHMEAAFGKQHTALLATLAGLEVGSAVDAVPGSKETGHVAGSTSSH